MGNFFVLIHILLETLDPDLFENRLKEFFVETILGNFKPLPFIEFFILRSLDKAISDKNKVVENNII